MKEKILKNKKDILAFIVFFLFIIFVLNKYGREVPYNPVEAKIDERIQLLSIASDFNSLVDLEELKENENLIPGAYAKRSVLLLKYNDFAQKSQDFKSSKLFIDGNMIQTDNFIFESGHDIYEIFITDNDLSNSNLEGMSVVNDDLIPEETQVDVDLDLINEDENILNIGENYFMRLPNIDTSKVLLMPIAYKDKELNLDIKVVNKDKSVNSHASAMSLKLNGEDWIFGEYKPLVLHINISDTGVDIEDLSVVFNDSSTLPVVK